MARTKNKDGSRRKRPTAAQRKQQKRLKKAVRIAKKAYKKNPRKKWTTHLKEAWKEV